MILFGIETEFGIQSEEDESADVVAESIALVRSALDLGVFMRWDYRSEDPHADARGFRVEELRQDKDEADYEDQDRGRVLTFSEIKSDLVLPNGARFYNDHAHPEYCTPECGTLEELVAQDRAGEWLVMRCAAKLAKERGFGARLYKNNTDFSGHSYGCHENYLIPRSLEWSSLALGIQSFLVTRQIFAGAGKFGFEAEDRFVSHGFQISQRSDFFTELESVDTMQRRPLVNTRDEPHADPALYRRFHVILGDANMSPFATALKVGSTALVLEAIVKDPGRAWPILREPLAALAAISRDPSCQAPLRLRSGAPSRALEIQCGYLEAVKALCDLDPPWKRATVKHWEEVLEDLAADPARCQDRLDWVAKKSLIDSFREAEGLAEDDPWLRSLDLNYHWLDRTDGLFYGLERSGWFRPVAGCDAGEQSLLLAPESTRAYVRGTLIRKFGGDVRSAQWDHVTLATGRGELRISLMRLFSSEALARARKCVDTAATANDLWELYEPGDSEF